MLSSRSLTRFPEIGAPSVAAAALGGSSSPHPAGTPLATISSRSGPALAAVWSTMTRRPLQAGQRGHGLLGGLLAAGPDQADGDLLAGGAGADPGRGHIPLAPLGLPDDLGQGQADIPWCGPAGPYHGARPR